MRADGTLNIETTSKRYEAIVVAAIGLNDIDILSRKTVFTPPSLPRQKTTIVARSGRCYELFS